MIGILDVLTLDLRHGIHHSQHQHVGVARVQELLEHIDLRAEVHVRLREDPEHVLNELNHEDLNIPELLPHIQSELFLDLVVHVTLYTIMRHTLILC